MDAVSNKQHSTTHRSRPNTPFRANDVGHTVPLNIRRNYKRRSSGSMSDGRSSDHDTHATMSDSEEHEMGSVGSDVEFDEESGLPTEERRKKMRNARERNRLEARIAGASNHGGISKEDARQADQDVGRKVVINTLLICSWYFFSLSISIYNKWMFSSDHLDFHFPLFTTSLHMLVQFILACTVLLAVPSLRPQVPPPHPSEPMSTKPKPLLTPLFYITRLIPAGTTTSLDIGLGNNSLRYITLTFYTMCKSSVLIFVLIFAFLFRLEAPTWRLILIILTMTLGVLMMVAGETAFNALGFALAISASFFSGFRWALTQILLLRHPATSNPFATLFFLAPIMFVTLFAIALASETPSAVIAGLKVLQQKEGTLSAVVLMFIPGFLAFCMICSEFTLLQRTNVVTLSICGIFKEVVTISAAGIVFHDELSFVNVSGLLVTIASIGCYNYLKITKMRREARERLTKKVDSAISDDVGGMSASMLSERGRAARRANGSIAPDEANMPLMDGEDRGGHTPR